MSQPPPDRDGLTPTLDYGQPPPPVPVANVFGGLFGSLAALVALPALAVGAYLVIYALAYELRADRATTLYQGTVLLAIAVVCTVAAVRWTRQAYGKGGRRRGPPGG